MLRYRWTFIACLYFLGVLLTDVLSTPRQSYTGLFALVPVLLALEWGPVVVALGSVSLVLLAITNIFGVNQTSTASIVIRSVGVAVGVCIGAYVASYREHHATVLSLSRAATEAAQDAILPRVPASIGSYRFSCAYRSAASESLIGGDFYKVIPTEFGVRLIIGDVRGKGLEAISLVSAVLGCFREWAPETALLKHLVSRLDARVLDKGGRDDFVTAVVATLSEGFDVEIANCGHPSPIHFRDGRPKGGIIPEQRATPLGLSPNPTFSLLRLAPGDRLLFYTDGLIECRDQTGAWIELDRELLGTLGSDSLESARWAVFSTGWKHERAYSRMTSPCSWWSAKVY